MGSFSHRRVVLLNNFKYQFKNKKEITDFADKIFKTMNINDNKSHPIKLRDEFKCDYLINTTNKTKEDIFNSAFKLVGECLF